MGYLFSFNHSTSSSHRFTVGLRNPESVDFYIFSFLTEIVLDPFFHQFYFGPTKVFTIEF